ncbi:4-hydroxybenzoate octaprenyltransferase [Candidatus Odyssella acanthamoebae]|uniref:4-hydroxybenzoate octaprenyltransferase n=1 Tax=Candidatus Odyssella acanthamoebae TaxID=91604 RepID=UPI00068D68DC|nr:4-hydroxybenzoate octaprenyltransferase [Candidatus Paracaedibacter acanthamoebae]
MLIASALWRLGRFDKPIGIALILFPCWWGLAYAQGLAIDPKLMLLFAIGATVMRAAGCIVNDYFDQDIDRHVQRTKTRPLASGEVTASQAGVFFFILCGLGLVVLLQLPPRCWGIGAIATVLFMIYPKAKRFTNYPQVVLGLAFNIGFPMAIAIFTPLWHHRGVWAAYGAGICWTVAYDTVYAFQDIKDDQHLEIGSTALTFGKGARPIIITLYGVMAALLSWSCALAHSSLMPYLCFISAATFAIYKVLKLNLKDIAECRNFFIANQWVGLIIFVGFLMR